MPASIRIGNKRDKYGVIRIDHTSHSTFSGETVACSAQLLFHRLRMSPAMKVSKTTKFTDSKCGENGEILVPADKRNPAT